MFGLSVHEKLRDEVMRACESERHVLYSAMLAYAKAAENLSEEEAEEEARIALDEYNAAIYRKLVTPQISNAVMRARATAVNRGFPEELLDHMREYGISAGLTFGFVYTAITNKSVDNPKITREISFLNHYQNQIVNEVLADLDALL